MHQRGCLKRVSELFPRHLLRGQPAKFLANEQEQFIRGLWIALLNRLKDARHFAHVGA
jgi:hypothetical protein